MAGQHSSHISEIATGRPELWQLEGELNHKYFSVMWLSREGAIADRERRLKPKRYKDSSSPTGYRTEYQLGWTAIRRPPFLRNGRGNVKPAS